MTVYAAIVGTDEAQMWEEEGTDRIDEEGHENWDTDSTQYNEYSLWFTDDDEKEGVTDIFNRMLCDGKKNTNGADLFHQ